MFQRPLPWKARLKGSVSDGPMVDDFEQPTQLGESLGDVGHSDAEGPMHRQIERTSFAARLRMIVVLAIICWAVLLGVVALIIA